MTNDRYGRQIALARATPIRLLRDRYEPLHSLRTDKWFYACRGSRLRDPAGKADPLWMVCLRSILRNIDKVTSEHIQAIPLRMREAMWERIECAELASVAVWRAFVSNGCRGTSTFKFCHVITDYGQEGGLDGNLETYTRRLHSPTSDWLVWLSIAGVKLSAADLSAIASLSNLEMLMMKRVPAVDDRTVRAWSRLASGIDSEPGHSRCFQKLKKLQLAGMKGITRQVWDFACEFPLLEEIDLGSGWEPTSRKDSSSDGDDQQRTPCIILTLVAAGSSYPLLENGSDLVHHAKKPRPKRAAATKSVRQDEENVMPAGHARNGQRHDRDETETGDVPSRHRQMNPRQRKRLRASLEETIRD